MGADAVAGRAGCCVGGIEGGRGGAPVTGDELVLAYWKIYESYMARKERLIEVTTTLYLAGVGALLLQDWTRFWLVHFRAVTLLLLPVVVLGAWFVRQQ